MSFRTVYSVHLESKSCGTLLLTSFVKVEEFKSALKFRSLRVCSICFRYAAKETKKCLLLLAAGQVSNCFIYALTTKVSPKRDLRSSSVGL